MRRRVVLLLAPATKQKLQSIYNQHYLQQQIMLQPWFVSARTIHPGIRKIIKEPRGSVVFVFKE